MIGAIVLAAGASTRMGRAKQLIEFEGASLLRRAARAAIDGGCDPVIVVLGASAVDSAAQISDLQITAVVNADWERGMGTSLRRGLRALIEREANLDAALALVCDQPYLDRSVVRRLLETWSHSGKAIAASAYANTTGVPACFARSLFPAILAIGDADGARQLIRRAGDAELVTFDWPSGAVDFDTPDDVARASKAVE